ncbi:hypothetical protein OG352_00765 [Streptomyces sp. NBC_01485]|nr:hypothetical protein [Streptomyces sp. NBC_01485]
MGGDGEVAELDGECLGGAEAEGGREQPQGRSAPRKTAASAM